MAKLVSSWVSSEQKLPKSYILPPGKRPGDVTVSSCKIPVVDLSEAFGVGRSNVVEQIMQAGQHFGLFQVVNHGVPKQVMAEAMKVFIEFFELPDEDKTYLNFQESAEKCSLYTSSFNYAKEDIHYWRDCLKLNCTSYNECIDYWPKKPDRYREIAWKYSAQVREVGMRILELISEGLRLEDGFFETGLTGDASLIVNHYPACPEPSLTLGLPKHIDPNLITLLHQGDVPGLQVCVDHQWFIVDPCPDAFVVNIGCIMQIITNGRLKGAEHRVVTNPRRARTTAGLFIIPSKDYTIVPAKNLADSNDPPLYKPFDYVEFLNTFSSYSTETEIVLDRFRIDA